jgi:hypothetical protein
MQSTMSGENQAQLITCLTPSQLGSMVVDSDAYQWQGQGDW